MRLAFALLVLLLLGTFAPLSLHRPPSPPDVSWVRLVPVERAPARIGRLELSGAWRLETNDFRIGGLSALHVADGEALAFSDAGWRIRFPVRPGPRPVRAEVAALPEGPGRADEKGDRDVEAAAVAGERVWISFERTNQVWRYRRDDGRSEARAAPRAMRNWRGNAGGEAMVRLPDGRFLIFAEGDGGDSEALLFLGDPALRGTKAVPLRYRPPEGYRITDAALLPDGRLLFLNRRFRLFGGFSAKLTVGRPAELRPGAVLTGEEVARLSGPLGENFEAVSVSLEGGRTVVWLVSDDNYNGVQRTVLLRSVLP